MQLRKRMKRSKPAPRNPMHGAVLQLAHPWKQHDASAVCEALAGLYVELWPRQAPSAIPAGGGARCVAIRSELWGGPAAGGALRRVACPHGQPCAVMVAPDVPDYSLVVRLGACGRGPAVHTDALASDSANREALFETAVNTLSLMLGHVRAVPAHGPGARAATHDLSLRQKRMVLGVCRCVHEQYGDCHLGLRRLALEADVSVSHLCALFTHGVGIPFRSYLRLWRLHKARAWLLEDRLEIKEIAFRAGFSDPNRLRLEFKADTGMAPRVWRETCRCTPASWTAAP